ncbi:MAG: hypothetical protein ILO42_06675 [Clostridia bacterium]|nr:hypothetical protein [Clostridia bacterium]
MKKTTLIPVAVVLAILFSVIACSIPASAAWDGESASASFAGGTGEENNPYILLTENDLARLAKTCNEGETYAGIYFKLESDLDLGNKLWPIIGATTVFSGNFDGGEHTITGLNVDTIGDYAGLFGNVKDGSIKNLTIEASLVRGYKYAGTVAGQITVTPGEARTEISNVHVERADKIMGTTFGGLVGRASSTGAGMQMFVTGCSVKNAKLESFPDDATGVAAGAIKNAFVGGIVGAAGALTVNGCSTENLTFDCGGELCNAYVTLGGIVGIQGASNVKCDILNCYAINNSFTIRENSTAPDAKNVCGGLVGRAGHSVDDSVIFNSFSYGNTFDNKKVPENFGGISGSIVKWINTANLSYDAEKAYAIDELEQEYPTMTKVAADDFKAADAVETLKLNDGNSKAVWVASPADGHPVIDLAALLENENTTVAWDPLAVEETTEASGEVTTDGQPVTEVTTDEQTTAEQTTAVAPVNTAEVTTAVKTPETTAASTEKKGCGGSVAVLAPVMILGAAVLLTRKKD